MRTIDAIDLAYGVERRRYESRHLEEGADAMAGRDPDPLELEAAAVIAAYFGGTDRSRDGRGALEGQHDFDIELRDGRCFALEVTSITDTKAMSFYETLGDMIWPAAQLRTDWWVALPDPTGDALPISVKRSRGMIVSALTILEQHEITELGPDALDPWARLNEPVRSAVHDAIAKLVSLGIVFVRSTQKRHDPDMAHLWFSTHGSAGSNPGQLNQLVAERAAKKCKKLAATEGAAERHLFVWLTGTYPDAELAFSTLPPPTTAPQLPSSVDVVWLATPSNGGPNRMWTLRPPGGWEVVDLSFLGKRYALPVPVR